MNTLSPFDTTLVVLLGASQHPNYPTLNAKYGNPVAQEKAFEGAAKKLYDYFVNGLGLPHEKVLSLFDDPAEPIATYDNIEDHIKKIQKTTTTIIIYYIGHAQVIEKQLYLATASINNKYIEETCIKVSRLAQAVKSSKGSAKVFYIFDCCFAGQAISDIQAKDSLAAVLGSSLVNEESVRLPNHKNTWFTEAFLQVLSQGNPSLEQYLSFSDVERLLKSALNVLKSKYNLIRAYPLQTLPSLSSFKGKDDTVAEMPLFPNPAFNRKAHNGTPVEDSLTNVPVPVSSWQGKQKPTVRIEKGPSGELHLDKTIPSQLVETRWKLGFSGEEKWGNSLLIHEKTIFIGIPYRIYAIDVHTGESLWTLFSENLITGLQETTDSLIFLSDKKIYAVNVTEGELRWSLDAPDFFSTDITTANGMMYIWSSSEKTFYTISIDKGEKHRTFSLEEKFPSPSIIYFSLLVIEDIAYIIGSGRSKFDEGSLYAINIITGTQLWSFDGSRDHVSFETETFLFDDVNRCLYVVGHSCDPRSRGDILYAINVQDGKLRWFLGVGIASIAFPPVTNNELVYIVSRKATDKPDSIKETDDTFTAIDVNTGEVRWNFAESKVKGEILYPPVVTDTLTFVGFGEQKYRRELEVFYILNNKKGEILRIANQLYKHRPDLVELLTGERTHRTSDKLLSAPTTIGEATYIIANSRHPDYIDFDTTWNQSEVHSGREKSKLYCIDRISGKQRWVFRTKKVILFPPMVINDHVYVVAASSLHDHKTTRPEAVSGEGGEPTIVQVTYYLEDPYTPKYCAGIIYILDEATGEELWSLDTKGIIDRTDSIALPPKISDGSFYYTTYTVSEIMSSSSQRHFLYNKYCYAFFLPEWTSPKTKGKEAQTSTSPPMPPAEIISPENGSSKQLKPNGIENSQTSFIQANEIPNDKASFSTANITSESFFFSVKKSSPRTRKLVVALLVQVVFIADILSWQYLLNIHNIYIQIILFSLITLFLMPAILLRATSYGNERRTATSNMALTAAILCPIFLFILLNIFKVILYFLIVSAVFTLIAVLIAYLHDIH